MCKTILCIVFSVLACTINKDAQPNADNLEKSRQGIYALTVEPALEAAREYTKYIDVPATRHMPELSFELTGGREKLDRASPYYEYYPVKLIIKTNKGIIQEIDFNKDEFEPCDDDGFGFEYGDYKFDGYGGFRLLHTSKSENPDSYFWIWDKTKQQFVEYPDLNLMGYTTFDYKKKEVYVSVKDGAEHFEFDTYRYINNKLTLVEKVLDRDGDGYRRVYRLIGGKMKLVETTESRLIG